MYHKFHCGISQYSYFIITFPIYIPPSPTGMSVQGDCPFNVPHISCYTNSLTGTFLLIFLSRPQTPPLCEGKGSGDYCFLYVLSSAVLISRKPMTSQVYVCHMTCDITKYVCGLAQCHLGDYIFTYTWPAY